MKLNTNPNTFKSSVQKLIKLFKVSQVEASLITAITLITLSTIFGRYIIQYIYNGKDKNLTNNHIRELDDIVSIIEYNLDKENHTIDINIANISSFTNVKELPLDIINRMLKYRDRLGGFVHENQYKEIYGITKEVITIIKRHTHIKSNFIPHKININSGNIKELVKHPYISYQDAKAIVNYTRLKKIKDINELADNNIITQEKLYKLKPYIILTVA